MQRALVVGGDSYIGAALCDALRTRGHDVISSTRREAPHQGHKRIRLDFSAPIPRNLPNVDTAFICLAMTKLADCRSKPDLAELVNFRAPVALARILMERGARVIFLSTSAVLDCREPWMREDRPRLGTSMYGRWKGAAEQAILSLSGQASVLRLTKVLKPDEPLIQRWIEIWRRSQVIDAFDDHRIAPITLSDIVDALLAIDGGGNGLYQVSGARDISYVELALELSRCLGLPSDLVRACHAASRGVAPEDVLPFTSLECSRLTSLSGFAPPQPRDVVRRVFCLDRPPFRNDQLGEKD